MNDQTKERANEQEFIQLYCITSSIIHITEKKVALHMDELHNTL